MLEIKGDQWLSDNLGEAFKTYSQRIREEQVAGDFLVQFQTTLEVAAATLPLGESRNQLKIVVRDVASRHNGAG